MKGRQESEGLGKDSWGCRALEADFIVRSIAERTLFADTAATQAHGGLADEVPGLSVGILQDDVALYAKWPVGADCDLYCFLCHGSVISIY